MLVIRTQQLQALRDARKASFVAAMERHLREFAPARFSAVNAEASRAFVRLALERAIAYGFRSERCCNLYIKLLLRLGAERGDEPEPPHVTAVLTQAGADPEQRLWHALALAAPPEVPARRPARPRFR